MPGGRKRLLCDARVGKGPPNPNGSADNHLDEAKYLHDAEEPQQLDPMTTRRWK